MQISNSTRQERATVKNNEIHIRKCIYANANAPEMHIRPFSKMFLGCFHTWFRLPGLNRSLIALPPPAGRVQIILFGSELQCVCSSLPPLLGNDGKINSVAHLAFYIFVFEPLFFFFKASVRNATCCCEIHPICCECTANALKALKASRNDTFSLLVVHQSRSTGK